MGAGAGSGGGIKPARCRLSCDQMALYPARCRCRLSGHFQNTGQYSVRARTHVERERRRDRGLQRTQQSRFLAFLVKQFPVWPAHCVLRSRDPIPLGWVPCPIDGAFRLSNVLLCTTPTCRSPVPGPPPCAPTNGRPGFAFGFLGAGGRLPKARRGRVFVAQFFFFFWTVAEFFY